MVDQYLFPRGKRGLFTLRVAVPRPLHTPGGKKERTKALGTSDLAEAKKRALPVLSAWRADWDSQLNQPNKNSAVKQVGEAGTFQLEARIAEKIYAAIVGEIGQRADKSDDRDAYIEQMRHELKGVASKTASGQYQKWENLAVRFVRDNNLDWATDSQEFRMLLKSLSEATVDAMQIAIGNAEGDIFAEPKSGVVVKGKQQIAARAKPGERIMELFERYAQQRVDEGKKRENGIAQDRMAVQQFAEFVGQDKSVRAITKEDAREYKIALPKIPRGYGKRSDYRGLDVRTVIARASKANEKSLSPTTQARYLSNISPFFSWLVNEGYLDANPFDGLHISASKVKNRRPPFSTEQLNTILQSPLFTGFRRDGREHLAGDEISLDWRFWVPLICLFTGARIGEIAQLRLADIQEHHERWFFIIKEDVATGQKTKSKKDRIVAVHPMLEEIGLVRFVKKQINASGGDNARRLFADLEPGKRQSLGERPARWWRNYLQAIGVKSGADGIGAHSFRHSIADQFRKAGYLDNEFGPLVLGHADGSVTEGYGIEKQGTAERLFKMIASVRYSGVNFSHLSGRF